MPCEGCTCGAADTTLAGDAILDERTRQARSFTAPHDYVERNEGIEPAIPLRSKEWWNNPDDGKSPCETDPDQQTCVVHM
jgi:dihydroxy-acid dehydratase